MKEISQSSTKKGIEFLKKNDKDFIPLLDEIDGRLSIFSIPDGFPGIIKLITEQQLSVASAKAIHNRVLRLVSPMTPEKVISTKKDLLKETGLSWQKVNYCLGISKACVEKKIDLDSFNKKTDEEILDELTKLKGIGEWTANCYLLGGLKRIDVFPSSDLVLQLAIKKMKCLKEKPNKSSTEEIASSWEPFRSIAALILWSSYEK